MVNDSNERMVNKRMCSCRSELIIALAFGGYSIPIYSGSTACFIMYTITANKFEVRDFNLIHQHTQIQRLVNPQFMEYTVSTLHKKSQSYIVMQFYTTVRTSRCPNLFYPTLKESVCDKWAIFCARIHLPLRNLTMTITKSGMNDESMMVLMVFLYYSCETCEVIFDAN